MIREEGCPRDEEMTDVDEEGSEIKEAAEIAMEQGNKRTVKEKSEGRSWM